MVTRRIRIFSTDQSFHDTYIMLSSDENSTRSPSFLARIVPNSQIDLSRVQRQLGICETHHGRLCHGGHSSTFLDDHLLRFIDVKSGNLVVGDRDMREKHDFRYATLSYAWGPERNLMTLKDNLGALHQPGSLSSDSPLLLRTIRDGIELTRSLGIPYIWIDALCIVQDDEYNKGPAIMMMDKTYGNSSLNICAATGYSGDNIRETVFTPRETRLPIAQLMDMKLSAVMPIESRIQGSLWNMRAWTFQERILSPKSPIFVDDRVYFQCRQVTWSEEVDLETTDSIWSLEMRDSPLQAFDRIPILQNFDYVKLFTKRHLNFPKDKLAAFAGIAANLSNSLASPMLFGITSAYFEWAMLWDRAEKGGMIEDSDYIEDSDHIGFLPSWSWYGWLRGSEWRLSMIDKTLLDLHGWLQNHTWCQGCT